MARPDHSQRQAYLVGGGIASLAAAAVMIRDCDFPGANITVLEETDRLGGSLDGAGDPQNGYVVRGGRMIEAHYACMFDLFDSIPTLDGTRTVSEETLDWNRVLRTGSKARLVRGHRKIDAPDFGLSGAHIVAIEKLAIEPERMLGASRISDHFDDAFFKTNFWLMWCTTFAFQPWHSAVEFKRYVLRFSHMIDGFNRLEGILRTVYNQYDSLVLPLRNWLEARGVNFQYGARVTDLVFRGEPGAERVARIDYRRGGETGEVIVGIDDLVLVTLGSMTEGSAQGGMDLPAPMRGKHDGGAWALWETLAARRPAFGHPGAFADHVDESKWLSFTTTLRHPALFDHIAKFTGNIPGEGGLITFADSAWLMSIVLPHQPHFIGQPADIQVMWGYGLRVDKTGDYVKKPMVACTGREIMTELLGHLGLAGQAEGILNTATCVPVMMPFITSQFLRRGCGDRPAVRPEGYSNLAFMGQYCELPDDVVFTVEYSVRSAMTAVYALLDAGRAPPPVYKGQADPRVLFHAWRALQA